MPEDATSDLLNLAGLTSAPLEVPRRSIATSPMPEFVRLPKPGTLCPYTGLTRGTLNSWILPMKSNGFKPPVKSYVIRRRGARTGVRVIQYESLRRWILAHEENGGAEH
jgi:hypothetical protein